MPPSSDRAPIVLDYPDLPCGIDPDKLIAVGRRSLRRRRYVGGATAITVLGAGGVVASALIGQAHPTSSLTTRPATNRSPSSNFWTDQTDDLTSAYPPVGATETLASAPGRGVTTRAIGYLDASGNVCAGSGPVDVDRNRYPYLPANVVSGTCSPSLAAVPSGASWITGTEVLAPAIASPGGDFVLLGFAAGDVAHVSIDTLNGRQDATLSSTATSTGERVWSIVVTGDSLHPDTDEPVTLSQMIAQDVSLNVTAADGSGAVIDTEALLPPEPPGPTASSAAK